MALQLKRYYDLNAVHCSKGDPKQRKRSIWMCKRLSRNWYGSAEGNPMNHQRVHNQVSTTDQIQGVGH